MDKLHEPGGKLCPVQGRGAELGRLSRFLSKKEKWEAEGDQLKKCIAEHLVQYQAGGVFWCLRA